MDDAVVDVDTLPVTHAGQTTFMFVHVEPVSVAAFNQAAEVPLDFINIKLRSWPGTSLSLHDIFVLPVPSLLKRILSGQVVVEPCLPRLLPEKKQSLVLRPVQLRSHI
jgi:hypothetical protein